MKLHQLVAIVDGRKSAARTVINEAHRLPAEVFDGFTRTYTPKDEDGETRPPEKQIVRKRLEDVISSSVRSVMDWWDVAIAQERGNALAKADIVVGAIVLKKDVPVGALLFLEKQLTDLRTFIAGLPELSPDREWMWDRDAGRHRTEAVQQNSTKKIPQTHVLFEPTEHQPGQAQVFTVDEVVGHWSTTHFSTAMPAKDKRESLRRCAEVLEAVKKARQQANELSVSTQDESEPIFEYILQH